MHHTVDVVGLCFYIHLFILLIDGKQTDCVYMCIGYLKQVKVPHFLGTLAALFQFQLV